MTQVSQRNIGRVAMFGVNSHVTCARLGMGELEDFAKRDSFPEVVKLGSLAFFDHDRPGFWEQNGYNMYGDPWKEQRYDTD